MNIEFILKQLYEVYLDQIGVDAEIIITKKDEDKENDSQLGVA